MGVGMLGARDTPTEKNGEHSEDSEQVFPSSPSCVKILLNFSLPEPAGNFGRFSDRQARGASPTPIAHYSRPSLYSLRPTCPPEVQEGQPASDAERGRGLEAGGAGGEAT